MFQKLERHVQVIYAPLCKKSILILHLFQLRDHAQHNHLSHLSCATKQGLNGLELKQMTHTHTHKEYIINNVVSLCVDKKVVFK